MSLFTEAEEARRRRRHDPAVYYEYKQERWTKAKCEKLVKRVARDGLGTPYPFPGHLHTGELTEWPHNPATADCDGEMMFQEFNGGITGPDDEWYPGVKRKLPKLPKGFAIISVPTWGLRIIKKGTCKTTKHIPKSRRSPRSTKASIGPAASTLPLVGSTSDL